MSVDSLSTVRAASSLGLVGSVTSDWVKGNVTLFNVGSSFSHKTGINGSRRGGRLQTEGSSQVHVRHITLHILCLSGVLWTPFGSVTFQCEHDLEGQPHRYSSLLTFLGHG